MTAYVTASAGVLCLVAAFLLATVGGMQWPRVIVGLTLTGVVGILNTTIGPWIRRGVNRADDKVGQLFGEWTGTVVTGLLAMVVVGVAALWIYRGKIDKKTLIVTALVPPSVTLIPGALGTVATTVVGIVPWVFGALITWMWTGAF